MKTKTLKKNKVNVITLGCSKNTFDSDFYDFSLLYGHPPKIIWLRTFNQSTNNIEVLLTKFIEQIKEFLDDNDDNSCLEILDKL